MSVLRKDARPCDRVDCVTALLPYGGWTFEDSHPLTLAIHVTEVPCENVSQQNRIPVCQGALPADIEFSRGIKVTTR